MLSEAFQHRFQQWLLTNPSTTTTDAEKEAEAEAEKEKEKEADARRLVAAAQRTFGRVFRRKQLATPAATAAACLRTDEDVRGYMARQAGAFGYELSLASISSAQRHGRRGAVLQTAQRAWNLLIDFLTAEGSGGLRAVGATSAEALGKLRVKVRGEGRDGGPAAASSAAAALAVGEEGEAEEEGWDAGEGEEEAAAGGVGCGGLKRSSSKQQALAPALRRAFAGWMEAHRRVSGQSAAGYCTSVDQILVRA